MKNKDIKKLIPPLASVLALGIGAIIGLSADSATQLEGALATVGTSVLTILGVLGVIKNNDK